jgi:hypothetical protein
MTTPEEREKWTLRVKKLLDGAEQMSQQAKAASVSAAAAALLENEAQARTAKAFELMQSMSITRAELEAAGGDRQDTIKTRIFEVRKPFMQKMGLLNSLAILHNCAAIRTGKVKSTVEKVIVYGYEFDLERLAMLWFSVLVQGDRFCAAADIPAGTHPPTFRRAWWQGYSVTVYNRLDAIKRTEETRAEQSTAGTALVLADRLTKTKAEMKKDHPDSRTRKSPRRRRFTGYTEGREAGKHVDLSTDTKLGDRKALTGHTS